MNGPLESKDRLLDLAWQLSSSTAKMTDSTSGSANRVLMWSGWAVLVLIVSISLGSLGGPGLGWLSLVVFGVGAPIALRQLNRFRARDSERQLLSALADRGQLTPMTAALRTSLTIEEAAEMLEALSSKGYLEAVAYEGVLAYRLLDKYQRETQEFASGSPEESPEAQQSVSSGRSRTLSEDSAECFGDAPDEFLSERELEVLRLLATGRSNKEISGDLFLALGTVKNHTSNAYRKLGAKNRTEAIARARELGLL